MKKTLLTLLSVLGIALTLSAQATGSAEQPLSVDEFLDQGIPSVPVANTYVTGYIVGYVPDMSLSQAIFNAQPPVGIEGVTEVSMYNILIAGASSEDVVANCIPVQLPSGSVRNALNLKENPGNLGRKVTLCGSHEKYFGGNGLKSVSAYSFDGNPIGGGDLVTPPSNDPVAGLNENFASIPANWTNIGTKQFYATAYQGDTYAAMTGYKGTPPFDSWLISPAVDMSQATEKVLTFDNQVNGYGSTTTTFKVYVMTTNDPATASKTELNANWALAPESGYSGWVNSGSIDLSSYTGNVYIGFNYVATEDANYATWCVTHVRLNPNGASSGDTPSNQGTAENPLTVADLLGQEAPAKDSGMPGWYVNGYIVGYVTGQVISSGANFEAPASGDVPTNLLLAGTADCKDYTLCLPVQLPAGDIRNALNLLQNPGLLGQNVTLCGTFEKYFNVNGLKKVVSYTLGGEVPPVSGTKTVYSGLNSNADEWTVEYAMPLADGLTYIWNWDEGYSQYKASAYKSGAFDSDCMTVSPEIDLTAYTEAELSWAFTGKFFASVDQAREICTVNVRTAGGEWTQLPVENFFANDSYTLVDNTADLSAYAGKKIQIGLHYSSTAASAGTLIYKNLTVKGQEGSAVRTVESANMDIRVANGSIIAPADAEVYSVNGMRSGRENLQKGIYIVRLGNQVAKVIVK